MKTFCVVRKDTCDPSISVTWLQGWITAFALFAQGDVAPDMEIQPPNVDTSVYLDMASVPPGRLALVFLGDPTEEDPQLPPGVLGYHTEDAQGRIFAPIKTSGLTPDQVSVTASHEGVEILGNENANAWEDVAASPGTEEAREWCDPCEDSSYPVNGYQMSNYTLKAYWDPATKPGTKVDKMGLLPGPHSRSDGGYRILRVDGVEQTDPPAILGLRKDFLSRCYRVISNSVLSKAVRADGVPTPRCPS